MTNLLIIKLLTKQLKFQLCQVYMGWVKDSLII